MGSIWIGSPNFNVGRSGKVTHITLHVMGGFLAGTDSTFRNSRNRVSATYGIGSDGTIHQYVRESDTAWADGNFSSNSTGISIEHEGGYPTAKFTDACAEASAQLCADIAKRYGLGKLVHNGIKGNIWLHREIPGSTHKMCPDLAINGINVNKIIDRANQILGEQVKMADYDEFATNWYRDRAQEGAERAIDKKLVDEFHTNWFRDRMQEGSQKAIDNKMTDEFHTNWIRDRAQEGAEKALQPINDKLDQIIKLLNK